MISDARLVLRARGGDQRAFEILLDRHMDVIGFACQRFFSIPGADEHDVRQEAQIAFYKAVHSYRPGLNAGFRYFAGVAIEKHLATALKTATRRKRRVLTDARRFSEHAGSHGLELADVVSSHEQSPYERVIIKEDLERMVMIVTEQCSPTERTVVARVLNGASLADAGKRGLRRHHEARAFARRRRIIDHTSQRNDGESTYKILHWHLKCNCFECPADRHRARRRAGRHWREAEIASCSQA
jgi:RNA polymerase sporulation-specific sigma factor